MNGYTESDAKVKARWEARKTRDDLLIARANHAACLLAETMRDCGNCKFQPDESVSPFLALSDTVAIAVTPKLPPAKNNTLQSFAENRERQFNQFYYGNQDGLPYFPHQTQEAQDK